MTSAFDIGLHHFLIVSIFMFAAGMATVLSKRNAIGILMGVELILNAAALNFVAFSRYAWPAEGSAAPDGHMFGIFIIVLAAAETAVALAIFLNFYNTFHSIDVERAKALKG